jgi:hypothetical protein
MNLILNNPNLRRDLNTYFYAILDRLASTWGWGYNESQNVLFFIPAYTLTTGWLLAEVWAKHWRNWQLIIAGAFLGNLLSGFVVFIIASANASKRERKALERRGRWSWWHLLVGDLAFTLFILYITYQLFLGGHRYDHDDTNGPVRAILALAFMLYLHGVLVLYHFFPASRVEGWLGLLELCLWTLTITFTGGCQSHFFYLYFVTLIPVLRRGFPEKPKQDACLPNTSVKQAGLLRRALRWHNRRWTSTVFWPFLFVAIAQLIGAALSVHFNANCLNEDATGSWMGKFLVNVGHFYISSTPFMLLLIIMAILMELETDSLRILRGIMEDKATKPWTTTLKEVVAELGLTIKENYIFRCSGVLVAVIHVPAEGGRFDGEAFKIDDVNEIEGKLEDVVKGDLIAKVPLQFKKPKENDSQSIYAYLQPHDHDGSDVFGQLHTGYFYYLDRRDECERFESFIDPLGGDLALGKGFWKDAHSVCYVILSHPTQEGGIEDRTYSGVFFKSEYAGEFDEAATNLYEALFTQVVGIHQKHQLYQHLEKDRVKAMARANAAGGLMHNIRNLIRPALSSSQKARRRFERLKNPRVLSLKKPQIEGLDDFWNVYLSASASAKIELDEIKRSFDQEGPPTDVLHETLDAYYEYLRSGKASDLTAKNVALLMNQMVECVHSSWKTSETWRITDELRPAKITNDEWERRKERLDKIRHNVSSPGATEYILWREKNTSGIIQYTDWTESANLMAPAGIIIQHILYELTWNAVKAGARQNIFEGRDEPFVIELSVAAQDHSLLFNISQGPCTKGSVEKALNALTKSDKEGEQVRGLAGILHLASNYGWPLNARYGGRKLNVSLQVPLKET